MLSVSKIINARNELLEKVVKQLQEDNFQIDYIKILDINYDTVEPLVLHRKEYYSPVIKWKCNNETFYYPLKPTIKKEKYGEWPFQYITENVYYEETLDDIIKLIKERTEWFTKRNNERN